MMKIYKAANEDARIVAEMAILMWEDNIAEELTGKFEELISNDDNAVFVISEDDKPVGFAQCQLRHDYVEGTDTSPVAYLEGIFVKEAYRKQWLAKRLLEKCEEWAKEKDCSEFASDCELDNEISLKFHLKMGFIEANRVICFTKTL